MKHPVAQPFTEEELEGANKIREAVKDIPKEFDTNFYLARWWRAYNGDLGRIKCCMMDLFNHRRSIGYDRISTDMLQTKLKIAQRTFERFCISSLTMTQRAGNVAVFMQRMVVNDIKEVVKVIPFSYVLHCYHILQESFTRAQLELEAASGHPAIIVVILDLSELNISDFLNPLSVSSRFARLIIKVWADYFTETMVKLYIINSNALIGVMWQVAKLIMDTKTQSRIEFLSHPSDLLNNLDPELVPAAYGGRWRDDSGYADIPELVCQKPIPITPQQYYDADYMWRSHGFMTIPKTVSETVKGGQTFEVKKICENDQELLLWHFTANNDLEFSIVRADVDEVIVWPKTTLASLKSPEQGYIKCKRGEYRIRFRNPSGMLFPLRLRYVIDFCPSNGYSE